jgi:DNA-binding HxlR family transcriptional regulator
MKHLIDRFDEVIHQKVRLAIMTLLAATSDLDFLELKKQLDLTDGNLSSHLGALEKYHYVAIKKSFVGKRPHTRIAITRKGRQALMVHLDALRRLLDGTEGTDER